MLSLERRWVAFLLGCIGTRLLFVILARFAPSKYLPYMGFLGAIQGLAFLYLWLTKGRQTGFEAGGKIWWAPLRVIHGLLYLTFAHLAFKKSPNAYMPLAADVIIGLIAFFMHHSLGYLA